MSYADVAASGPKQTPAEAAAPAPPQLERHEDASTEGLVDVDGPHVRSVPSELSEYTDTQAQRAELEARDAAHAAEEEAHHLRDQASSKAKSLKGKARAEAQELDRNKDNPVVIGNATILGLGAVALGFGAYYKHTRGELSGRLVGIWAAGLTTFAVADYFTSQWLFKNKFPKK